MITDPSPHEEKNDHCIFWYFRHKINTYKKYGSQAALPTLGKQRLKNSAMFAGNVIENNT